MVEPREWPESLWMRWPPERLHWLATGLEGRRAVSLVVDSRRMRLSPPRSLGGGPSPLGVGRVTFSDRAYGSFSNSAFLTATNSRPFPSGTASSRRKYVPGMTDLPAESSPRHAAS